LLDLGGKSENATRKKFSTKNIFVHKNELHSLLPESSTIFQKSFLVSDPSSRNLTLGPSTPTESELGIYKSG